MVPPDRRPRKKPLIFRAWYQDEYNPAGHTDDARAASREKGERLLKAAVECYVAALEEFINYRPLGTRLHSGEHAFPRPKR